MAGFADGIGRKDELYREVADELFVRIAALTDGGASEEARSENGNH